MLGPMEKEPGLLTKLRLSYAEPKGNFSLFLDTFD